MSFTTGHYERIRALATTPKLLFIGGVRTGAASQIVMADHNAEKVLHVADVPAHVLGLAVCGDSLAAALNNGGLWFTSTDLKEDKGKDKDKERSWKKVQAHQGACTAVTANSAGDLVASAGTDGFLRLWDGDGKKKKEWQLSTQPLRAVALDPTGTYAAAAGDDGIVRSVTIASGDIREMAGHTGPVYALCFTPRDGRLVSGGDDGTLRIWYLAGEVECEVRGAGQEGHEGAVLAIVFSPTPEAEKGEEPEDRIYSAGSDGKVKCWRLESRIKPKTIEIGEKAVYALSIVTNTPKERKESDSLGYIFIGDDDRHLGRYSIDTEGAPSDYEDDDYENGFSEHQSTLGSYYSNKNKREEIIKELAPLDEPEAIELVINALQNDREADNRATAAKLLGEHKRVEARPRLKEKLNDYYVQVRKAAFEALQAIEGSTSLSPFQAALSSNYSDLKHEALTALKKLGKTSPLVPNLIAQKVADNDHAIRLYALDCLSSVLPEPEALANAFERGNAQMKTEVLIRAAMKGLTKTPEVAPLVGRALDDSSGDYNVRRIAFAVKALERKGLATHLEEKDDEFEKAVLEISRRCAQLAGTKDNKATTDEEIKAARQKLPGAEASSELTEEDLEPLLISMACRASDTALRGARGLAKLGDIRALGALLQISRENESHLRREAAASLRELKDPRAKKRLLWMLNDAEAKVREEALKGYKKLEGASSLTVAEAALRSAFEDIRNSGLKPLLEHDKTSKKHQEAIQLLEDAIEDESEKVRLEAFKTLWAWYQDEPQKLLDRTLLARFPDLRLLAIVELERAAKEPWAEERLRKTIGDRDANVGTTAYEVVLKLKGKEDTGAHLSALASTHASLRIKGAKGAEKASDPSRVRDVLSKIVSDDEDFNVRISALETLDKLSSEEPAPLLAGLKSTHADYRGRLGQIWSVRVRAAELLSNRRYDKDNQLVEVLQGFLADREPSKWVDTNTLNALRVRAATALASLGLRRLVKYFGTELIKDEDPNVREQAARGLAMAAQKGDEGSLLDALGHQDIWVRSWAGDGLARLGDSRAVPVLTGTLRHTHPPIRLSAVVSFATLGPEGYGGMLQGLEDPLKEIQDLIFSVVLARDVEALRNNQPPDLLTSALSSQRHDVRFAAARALELRADPSNYLSYVIESLLPAQPEKASEMKDWPSEEDRAKLMAALVDALASDAPEVRYAAAMTLRVRHKPLEYFREVARLAKSRSAVVDTAPKKPDEGDTHAKKGWLRRLFAKEKPKAESEKRSKGPQVLEIKDEVPETEQAQLRRLAFGAYVGLLRQTTTGDEEGHRVRRDSVERVVDLGLHGGIGVGAALPAILRALDDPNHLVRRAAFSGLKKLFPKDKDHALDLALGSVAADVAKDALDEISAQGQSARPRIVKALSSTQADVRQYAFEKLEKLYPKGSLEPLLAALSSSYADLRIGVIEKLANSDDKRVTEALSHSLTSDHEDLRLRAAELLAERKDSRAADVLSTFLRHDNKNLVNRAVRALTRLGAAGVRVLSARLEEVTEKQRIPFIKAIGRCRHADGIEPLTARFEDEDADVRKAAFEAAIALCDKDIKLSKRDQVDDPNDAEQERAYREKLRDMSRAIRVFRAGAKAKDPELRALTADDLDVGEEVGQNDLLVSLFGDRDPATRVNAVTSYAYRVTAKNAPLGPLEDVLKVGKRDLVLAAAEGAAAKHSASALRSLLLVVRAGEAGERERAILGLGTLGDPRALAELETVAAGGTQEAPVEPSMQAAAAEALGRLAPQLKEKDAEAKKRIIEKVEELANEAPNHPTQLAAVRGLRAIGGERSRNKLEVIMLDRQINMEVRVLATSQLGKIGDPEAEKALVLAMKDTTYYAQNLRQTARKALDKLFPNDRLRVELLAIDCESYDISEPAVGYLANEGDPALLVPKLATLQNDELRQRLRFGLLRRKQLPASALASLLTHDLAKARQEAAWLIAARANAEEATPFSEEEAKKLSESLIEGEKKTAASYVKADNDEKRAEEAEAWKRIFWAARGLNAQGLVKGACALIKGGDKKGPALARREAVRLIAALGKDSEIDELTIALKDSDADVRSAAAYALAKLSPEKAPSIAMKVKPLDPVAFAPMATKVSTDLLKTNEGRRLLLPGLLVKGDVSLLFGVAKEGDKEDRFAALEAIGRAGGEAAIGFLKSFMQEHKNQKTLFQAAYRAFKRAQRKAQQAKKFEAKA